MLSAEVSYMIDLVLTSPFAHLAAPTLECQPYVASSEGLQVLLDENVVLKELWNPESALINIAQTCAHRKITIGPRTGADQIAEGARQSPPARPIATGCKW